MIHLDFETRSHVNIFKSGSWVYSQDPSTEILCMAWAIDDGPVELITKEQIEDPNCPDYFGDLFHGHILCAHNALFEQSIWKNILVDRFGWAPIPIKNWRCTAAKAAAHSLPRGLGDCGHALGCTVQKDNIGYRMMMKLCKSRPDGSWYEDPKDLQVLYDYCRNDVEAEREIDLKLPDLTADEQTIWFEDQLINQRGIYVDYDAIQRAIKVAAVYTEKLNLVVADVSNGVLDRTSRRMSVLQWCHAQGVNITGYTKEEVAATLEGSLPDAVRTVLETRVAVGKTSIKKYQAMHESTCVDGRIRDLLIYHGASTGRWAGKLIQIQNLPKGNVKDTDTAIEVLKKAQSVDEFEVFYPDVMGTLSACIRGMIIPAPKHKFLIADYAAIEARVVMWLAGEENGLKQFREFDAGSAEEPYIVMAKNIYNREDIPRRGTERQLGKTAILGCGFGMGSRKFLATCINWGIPIPESLAQKSVDTYRSIYPRVKDYWHTCESMAIRAIQNQTSVDCGKVRWYFSDNTLFCRLPSGRNLVYNNVSLEYVDTPWGERKLAIHFYGMGQDEGKRMWRKEHTYGGKLVENITQAVARDILATAMFNCEKKGYRVAFSVHDEIVSEVPESFGTVDEFESILCSLPKWAHGCPIAAKGFVAHRYRKD